MSLNKSVFLKKKIVLGITASIAAYKAASICSRLTGMGAEVVPVMTPNALNFITPITLSSISGNKTIVDQFTNQKKIYHISLSHSADIFLIAPASADTISKLSYGIGDNFLTTSAISAACPVLVAPAMNESMYLDPVIQKNIKQLKESGKYFFVGPKSGRLACGEEGLGRMEDEDIIIERLGELLKYNSDLKGKKVLITAGGTREFIDSVRYISNKSSGKMGYTLAEEAYFRGAKKVILISAAGNLAPPYGVKIEYAPDTAEMKKALLEYLNGSNIIIMAAAVSDIIPVKKYDFKLKKKDDILSRIRFKENENILELLAEKKKKGQYLVGFAAESDYSVEAVMEKVKGRNIDMIVGNDISREGIGMESDYNEVDIIRQDGSVKKLARDKKRIIARGIWDEIIKSLVEL
ncbi:MAG TPA: bifunctional phosphopantothenoylcysteine decarboxylase/phosphopantothenate--cysteine ligase CoaBC [Candidatus Hydromicrobium sp.]